MQPSSSKLPVKFIAAGVVIALLVVGAIIFAISSNNTPKTSSTPTPTPDVESKGPLAPKFAGFDSLLDHGVTSDQVDALQYAFTKYGKASGKSFKQVTLDGGSLVVENPNPDLNYSVATFKINLEGDKTTYYATLHYFKNLTASELQLATSKGGPVVYDSGSIDLFEGTGE